MTMKMTKMTTTTMTTTTTLTTVANAVVSKIKKHTKILIIHLVLNSNENNISSFYNSPSFSSFQFLRPKYQNPLAFRLISLFKRVMRRFRNRDGPEEIFQGVKLEKISKTIQIFLFLSGFPAWAKL